MSRHQFWTDRMNAETKEYTCFTDGCGKSLKAKISNTDKNPGRNFVSCNRDYGGCGFFGWLDEEPKAKFAQKRGRSELSAHAAPHEDVLRDLANLAAQFAQLRSEVAKMKEQVENLIDQQDELQGRVNGLLEREGRKK